MENKQVRRLYLFVTLYGALIASVSVLIGVFYVPPAIFTKTISAENVMIKGQPGQPSAWLGQDTDGNLGLFFYDQGKNNRMSVFLYPNGRPSIIFYDNNRKPRLGMTLSDKGFPVVRISNEDGIDKRRILLSTEDHKEISIFDEKGNLTWKTP